MKLQYRFPQLSCLRAFRTSQASALYIDNKDHVWYSVSELLEYKKEYDREAEDVCGVDSICLEELFFSKMDSMESKFQAFNQLMQQQIQLLIHVRVDIH